MTTAPKKTQAELEAMSEKELAEYYDSRREAIMADGEGVELAGVNAPLDEVVSTRFATNELSAVKAAAARAGMRPATFIRKAALAAAASDVIDLQRLREDLGVALTRIQDAAEVVAVRKEDRERV
ncbi:plasmid mobilization protein [Actinomadura sp. 6N118]|uniref:plasmid mobilization protein n=1 Tax=Actinomadura sp. 6N118 TaxID=3375151 RepID=UPI003787AFA3